MKLQCHLQKATLHKTNLPTRKMFSDWIKLALKMADAAFEHLEMTIRLVDEAESAQFNETYRHKVGHTNILSFSAENPSYMVPYYLGDLLVCVPLVLQEAATQGKSEIAHWAHLIVHGVLHLLGYDHIKKKEAAQMEALEIKILAELGFKNPYL